jgi:RNA polymerase sigma-70 factor (ECF subfamily)
MTDHERAFEDHRVFLRGLAYRMTGSLTEAEDLLQDAFLKWRSVTDVVGNPRAYLSTLMTRLCLDWLKSARVTREAYVGPWLPEPVLDEGSLLPDASSELAHDISLALMLALERLSPLERAAFLLHDVFDVDFAEIAQTLGKSEPACRQLARRARTHLRESRPRRRPTDGETERVLGAFARAVSGDFDALRDVLTEDATFYADGGGRVPAATLPIVGRDDIVRFLTGVLAKFRSWYATEPPTPASEDLVWRPVVINGMPGFVMSFGGRVLQTLALDIQDGRIAALYATRNPDKLTGVTARFGASSN